MKRKRTRISQLFSKVRSGTITPQEETELQALEQKESAALALNPVQIYKSIWDLPIAKGMWQADMRDMRR